MPRFSKPVRPTPNRTKSLWRQCLFALAVGWPRGARGPDPGTLVETDDQSRSRGLFSSSIDPTHWDVTDAGWMLDSDGTSAEQFTWPDIGGKFAIDFSFTAAVLTRPSIVDLTAPTFSGLYSKLESNTTFVNRSWSIHQDSNAGNNNYRGEFIDTGLLTRTVDSGVVPSTARTDLVILRYNRTAGSLQIWVNGIRRASLATTAAVLNNSAWPLGVARPQVSSTTEWKVGMLGLWGRPLVDRELANLWTDPFTMWKA